MTPLTIPWFKLEPWALPPWPAIEIQPFGVLSAIAILVGSYFAQRRARQIGVDPKLTSDYLTCIILVGLPSAYLLNIVMYAPATLVELWRDPSLLWTRWHGLSSYGGFIGGTLASIWFARRRGQSLRALADIFGFAIPFAWVFARMGCFVVHDHPGIPSDFVLAVDDWQGSGVARHDLGLYEVLWSVAVASWFWWRSRKPRPVGDYLPRVLLLYGPVRFALDFLRIPAAAGGDARYLGLTPAQSLSLLLTVVGLVLYLRAAAFAPAGSDAVTSSPSRK